MRRHVFSSIAILVMVLLAFGSTNSNTSFSPSGDSAAPSPTSKSSETDHSNPSSPLSESSNAEVDRVYEERFSKYEQELAAWNAADDARKAAEIERADLQPKIDQLEKQKPITPEFEEREWVTIDGRYKTLAVLVDTDYIKIKLRKSDGKDVTVERDKLDAEGRIYIGKAFSKLQAFRRNMKDWEGKRQELTDNLASAEARIASADKPKPEEPTRQVIADEIAAKAAKRKEEERLVNERATRKRQKEILDEFVDRLSAANVNSIIQSVSVSDETATITVTNAWHYSVYQVRLQAAQNLWKIWASIASPSKPDRARIKIVDFNGNEVGGSRILGGSLIWVQED